PLGLRDLHPLPARRSSDLEHEERVRPRGPIPGWKDAELEPCRLFRPPVPVERRPHLGSVLARREVDPPERGLSSRLDPGLVRRRSEEHTSELQSREKLVCR